MDEAERQETIVSVDLGPRSYPVHVGPGLLGTIGPRLASVLRPVKAAVISDATVAGIYGDAVIRSLADSGIESLLIEFPPGEESKSLARAETIYDRLADFRLERGDAVVTLGGGVSGDLGGFVAATWMRGVPVVHCPTTIEAAVDASVGGKTAVNLRSGKNLVGVFHQPRMVLVDTDCLATLEPRDVTAGLAESIKHAVIADPAFFQWHDDHAGAILSVECQVIVPLIAANVRIKASIVSADETERSGRRALLNFGHTIGHAIESLAQYRFRHGECVAMGMVAACELSVLGGLCRPEIAVLVRNLLERFGLPATIPPEFDDAALLRQIRLDKKASSGRPRFVLVEDIGKAHSGVEVEEPEISAALERCR